MITPTQLQTDFPEWATIVGVTSQQLTSMLQFWLNAAYSFLNADRWGAQLDLGAELFAMHHVALECRDLRAAAGGAIPGLVQGIVTSKAVGDVSEGLDVSHAMELDAGHWNNTLYGTRFIRIARMMGAGPIQVGIGFAPPFTIGAWSGPPCWPGWLGS